MLFLSCWSQLSLGTSKSSLPTGPFSFNFGSNVDELSFSAFGNCFWTLSLAQVASFATSPLFFSCTLLFLGRFGDLQVSINKSPATNDPFFFFFPLPHLGSLVCFLCIPKPSFFYSQSIKFWPHPLCCLTRSFWELFLLPSNSQVKSKAEVEPFKTPPFHSSCQSMKH